MLETSPSYTQQTLDYDAIFSRLQSGHTLVTGNSRLSRILEGRYNQWRISRGDSQWPTADILSWNLWLDRLWVTATLAGAEGTDRAVPNPTQVTSLWERVLKLDKRAETLLRPESLANQLKETRSLVKTWGVDLSDFSWLGEENENHSAFHHWNGLFEQLCIKDGWLAAEDRTPLLCQALLNKQLEIKENIDLLGFDEFNPAQISLLDALDESAACISNLSIVTANNKPVLFEAEDSKSELEQMARWARYWLEKNPQASIAIVVPDLQARRAEVEQQLGDILRPGAWLDDIKPWNISMGIPLARTAMITAAFDLLQLLSHRLEIDAVGRVLRSPWLNGGTTERSSRALLEKQLREVYPRQIKLTEVRYQAQIRDKDPDGQPIAADERQASPWSSPELVKVLNKLISFQDNNGHTKTASAWAQNLDKLLVSLGWPMADPDTSDPGTAAETHDEAEEQSRNWQTLAAWAEALAELASLDATLPKLNFSKAISLLRQICMEKIYQPKSPAANIQVLGLYEINGLRFDHLWVLGLHAGNWPPNARPNPFIPGKLQQAAGLPHSSPQRELKVARVLSQRLLDTAADTIFSYPGMLDGEEVLPSPLLNIQSIKNTEQVPVWPGDNWAITVAKSDSPKWENLQMPEPLGQRPAKGGSTILKHQALCPFRAFAENRLIADGLNTPADGIDPRLHGSLLHEVLELFWKETRTQAALLALDPDSLSQRLRRHVDRVTADDRGLNQRPAFREVEANRIQRQVLAWLELEKQREGFEVISFEEKRTPLIKGQEIRLYIDRIDQLMNGKKVIIDYKTGKVDPKKWFGERPEDPQLPLYAISEQDNDPEGKPETPAGVVFAVIRDGEFCFKGVVNREGILPNLPPKRKGDLQEACRQLPETIDNWRHTIHRLMKEFLAGEAAIDPKHGSRTCENSYCELQPLCRIRELEQQQQYQTAGTSI